jgi:hypothetical protein
MDGETSLLSGLSAETAHHELTDPDSDTEDDNEDLDFESLLKSLKLFPARMLVCQLKLVPCVIDPAAPHQEKRSDC